MLKYHLKVSQHALHNHRKTQEQAWSDSGQEKLSSWKKSQADPDSTVMAKSF